jgi:hypothetical protein
MVRAGSKPMLNCGELLVQLLEEAGVNIVFGIPGVHTVELYRGLPATRIRHVTRNQALHAVVIGGLGDQRVPWSGQDCRYKRARHTDPFKRFTNDARLERREISVDIGEFGHVVASLHSVLATLQEASPRPHAPRLFSHPIETAGVQQGF